MSYDNGREKIRGVSRYDILDRRPDDARSLRYRVLRHAVGFITAIEIPLILILTMASGYYTYRGALSLNTDITAPGIDSSAHVHALVISISVSAALFCLLTALMRVFPELTS